MNSKLRKSIKEDKGAVAVLVIITVLTFVLVLLGSYLTVTTLRKSQLNNDKRIQEIYGNSVNSVDEIYNELVYNNSNMI